MKVYHLSSETNTRHSFDIISDGVPYYVVVYVNSNGKFVDDQIAYKESGEELSCEGTEGDIRENIIDYLDENWGTLTK